MPISGSSSLLLPSLQAGGALVEHHAVIAGGMLAAVLVVLKEVDRALYCGALFDASAPGSDLGEFIKGRGQWFGDEGPGKREHVRD